MEHEKSMKKIIFLFLVLRILIPSTLGFAKGEFDLDKLKIQLKEVETKMKGFVPGYKITLGPIIENERLIIMNEVEGRGDYLPPYAGNLDVINNAAIYVAEKYAQRKNNNY